MNTNTICSVLKKACTYECTQYLHLKCCNHIEEFLINYKLLPTIIDSFVANNKLFGYTFCRHENEIGKSKILFMDRSSQSI